mmetsp:Transcript_26556/g.43482  ORF Transcript_26556/g.43482 Transcript_26556/m.43482 type:complete len:293 (+) Transcript_26556:226-1104(+)|eukprot:CAMPEP_0184648076 /NCGR_PEP_ID=MMETSP0308-20130426/5156_1 /TAXON_ID=38269 /ORGANISM="Gloeochaete witrockiana, Strain SAG 46.84" /LENGTH=292 /DNA_ID=CAMNT_0027079633 /DNA_START=192 /DNA_END=1070 /DNA_ORIENTATION=-
MAEEIDYYDQELRDLLDELDKDFVQLSKLKEGQRRDNKLDQIQERVNRAKNDLRSFNVEFRDLPKDRVPEYEKKGKDYDARIKKFAGDLKWAKSAEQVAVIEESRKAEAAAAAEKNDGAPAKKPMSKRKQELMETKRIRVMEEVDPDTLTGKELVQVASKVQDKSKKSLMNQQRMVEEAKQIGASTAVKLKSQTEQIQRTADKVNEIESDLKRADKIIRTMLRGVARDKLAIVFMFLIVGALGFIIYWKVSGKGGSSAIYVPNVVGSVVCAFGACTPTPMPTPSDIPTALLS